VFSSRLGQNKRSLQNTLSTNKNNADRYDEMSQNKTIVIQVMFLSIVID